MSGVFRKVIGTMTDRNKDRVSALPDKYLYFTSAAVDWEIIRLSPLRYLWNETEQLAVYGLALALLPLSAEKVRNPVFSWLSGTPSAKYIKDRLQPRSVIGWNRLVMRTKDPIAILNLLNFVYLFAGYVRPFVRPPDDLAKPDKPAVSSQSSMCPSDVQADRASVTGVGTVTGAGTGTTAGTGSGTERSSPSPPPSFPT